MQRTSNSGVTYELNVAWGFCSLCVTHFLCKKKNAGICSPLHMYFPNFMVWEAKYWLTFVFGKERRNSVKT
jgi:hypothetical protein